MQLTMMAQSNQTIQEHKHKEAPVTIEDEPQILLRHLIPAINQEPHWKVIMQLTMMAQSNQTIQEHKHKEAPVTIENKVIIETQIIES
jgi:hypothetical protein